MARALATSSSATSSVQSATFAIGRYSIVLTATAGDVRLGVAADGLSLQYAVAAERLAAWAENGARLLAWEPSDDPTARAEFRAPFLLDVTRNPTIALGCAVDEAGLGFRLHVSRRTGDAEIIAVERDVVEALIEAASGASHVAGTG